MPSKPSHTLVRLLLVAQQDRCFYCGGSISFDKSRGWLRATIDHFYPTSRGGSKGISNVVLACDKCNARKRAKKPRLHELLKSNKLAAVWPHINPINLESLVPQKECTSCGQDIPIERLLQTRRSLTTIKTCSPECSKRERNRRTRRIRRTLGRNSRAKRNSCIGPGQSDLRHRQS